MLKKIVLGMVSLAIIVPASLSLAEPEGRGTHSDGFGGQLSQQSDRPISNTNQLRMDFTNEEDSELIQNQLQQRQDLFGKNHPKAPDLQNNPGFQHGMSQATTQGQDKKTGLGHGLQNGRGHRR